jgi:propionyl-CoA carboxylase alpha chain
MIRQLLFFNNSQHTADIDWPVGTPILNATVDNARVLVQVLGKSYDGYVLQYCGTKFTVQVQTPVEKEFSQYMPVDVAADTANFLLSPMPGRVISINVKQGDTVTVGQPLAVVEAMKMQNILRSQKVAVVKKVLVIPGANVAVDEVLVEFEPVAAQ